MLWAISDLHLSFSSDKPMDIFGPHWVDHHSRIERAWRESVSDTDTVLIPGDISWAMKLDEAEQDLHWLGALPGQKIIMKGNHDYWWDSVTRVRSSLPQSVKAIQNDALETPGAIVFGSRGWLSPGSPGFDEESDRRVYDRELGRLELSLSSAMKMKMSSTSGSTRPLIAMMHYPPVVEGRPTEFARLLSDARVSACVYGHLHLQGEWSEGLDCEIDGVRYLLVSCDYTGFAPVRVPLGDTE